MKNGEIAFNLTCECAMTKNDIGEDEGYCPLPNKQVIEGYIEAIKAVWYQDNCHTLDRVNYRSAIACGIGNYDTSLSDALDLKLQTYFHPWVQKVEVKTCLVKTLPDTPRLVTL